MSVNQNLNILYEKPLPSKRSGALFNAFPYPTKISPEAIAIFIACHTNVGDTILDPFAGSGTTGLAGLLCDCPTDEMKRVAKELGVKPKWGARNIVLQELSSLGAFVADTLCNPPCPNEFEKKSNAIIDEIEKEYNKLYQVTSKDGKKGQLRYAIWSDILECPKCKTQITFWDSQVEFSPLSISSDFTCKSCGHKTKTKDVERVTEKVKDYVLDKKVTRRKRLPVKIYAKSEKDSWRETIKSKRVKRPSKSHFDSLSIPNVKTKWGDLYRKGYHTGMTHIHHFYTDRNLIVFGKLWERVNALPSSIINPIKAVLLSYNASHSTLMSRVVVKKNNKDLVLTGAQSGVLYISSLPVEKNIFQGVRRKIKTFKDAFELVKDSRSSVKVFNTSSTKIELPNNSVDYIFTDPPFGGYIPYSEINQINEAWLGVQTKQDEEVIVSHAQNKSEGNYEELMNKVFQEMERVLKEDGKTTLVFHSAKASIWRALMSAYNDAGFDVIKSSVLDKVQGSFKQVTSTMKVQGDPLLLLQKRVQVKENKKVKFSATEIIDDLIKIASSSKASSDERTPERLYSRFISRCLELKIPIKMNAEDFYKYIGKMSERLTV